MQKHPLMKVQLPVVYPEAYDNSLISSHGRCPRMSFYKSWLGRAPTWKNYALKWGGAYHLFREALEGMYMARGEVVHPYDYAEAISLALESWGDPPPVGHKRDWMTNERFIKTLELSYTRWEMEKRSGKRRVLMSEQPFTLELPSGKVFGGIIDQVVEWRGKLWIRDFKTTSRMGYSYAQGFDPSHQMSGYVHAAQRLSGRPVEGVIIETVYNNKSKGPEIYEHLSTRSEGNLEMWQASIESEIRNINRHEEEGFFPMRTEACNDYGGCFFREACQKEYWTSTESWLLDNTTEDRWDFLNRGGD